MKIDFSQALQLPEDGLVVVGCLDGSVYAVHESNGTLAYSYATDGPVTTSPVLARPPVPTNSSSSSSSSSGANRANETGGTGSLALPANVSSPSTPLVVVGSRDGSVHAFHARDGSRAWQYATGSGIASTARVTDDQKLILVGSRDHYIHAVHAATGGGAWMVEADGFVDTQPLLAEGSNETAGRVYFGSSGSKFYAARYRPQGVADAGSVAAPSSSTAAAAAAACLVSMVSSHLFALGA